MEVGIDVARWGQKWRKELDRVEAGVTDVVLPLEAIAARITATARGGRP